MDEPLSERGKRTRQRILGAAAALVQEQGARTTSVDQVLAASGAGKGQFYYYFDNKAHLLREVIAYQLRELIAEQRPLLEHLDSWEGIECWFGAILDWHRRRDWRGGCPFGSLAAELADFDPELRAELAEGFDCWESFLSRGLAEMKARGDLRSGVDPDALAEATLSIIQGGILLSKTKKAERPLRNALSTALASLRAAASVGEDAE
jgi:AcrR family transcriptional regulator